MNNLKSPPIVEAPLNVLGGIYTECDPNDLPPGASPRAINCDFRIGSVLKRPGLRSGFYFLNFFIEKLCGFAASVADGPDETAWNNPINASKGIPGNYATVQLNQDLTPVDGLVSFYLTNISNGSLENTAAMPALTPEEAGDWFVSDIEGIISGNTEAFTPDDPDWQGSNAFGGWNGLITSDTTPLGMSGGFSGGISVYWSGAAALAKVVGGVPVPVQAPLTGTGGDGTTRTFANPISPGSCLVAFLEAGFLTKAGSGYEISDNVNGGWTNIVFSSNASEPSGAPLGTLAPAQGIWVMLHPEPGEVTTVEMSISPHAGASYAFVELPIGSFGGLTEKISQELRCLNFPLSIPSGVGVIGFQVEVTGHQTALPDDAVLTVGLLAPSPDSPTMTFQLPTSDATVVLGEPTENWGLSLTPTLLNNPSFGVKVKAFSPSTGVTFNISGVKLKVYLTPDPAPDINYLKTFEQQAGEIRNLLLDSNGIMWEEDPLNLPGALNEVYDQIEPDTFAQSTTEDNREFIALSNLLNGTDIPYTYNGVNFDRCSQIGPGAAPSVTVTSSNGTIDTITQQDAFPLVTGNHDFLNISDAPADHGDFGTPATPGNVMALVFESGVAVPAYFTPGSNIVLTGFPAANGNRIDNDPAGVLAPAFYTITSIGQKISGQQSYNAIVFTVPFTTFFNEKTPAGCAIQSTTATMTTEEQVPDLEVGEQFSTTNTGGGPPGGYDGTWTVLTTPNAAQMEVTETVLVNNTATYSYILQTGTAPTVGQTVTVALTLNGNGIFNVTNAVITAASAGSFSLNLVSANITSAVEQGAAIVFGTIFTFDAFQVIGNESGGDVETTGIIGEGQRECCYAYLTRNGYISQMSPIAKFNVTSGASKIAVANLLPGVGDVIARIVFFTAGNGGNFYWISEPVLVQGDTGTITNTATIVNDNITTNASFSFSDDVLLGTAGAGGSADVQGSNYFETKELGACRGFVQYDGRMFAIGEQNKVSNFRGLSFDGGIGVIQSQSAAGGGAGINLNYPAGWTIDQLSTAGQGVGVAASPIFGNAYTITNTSGSTADFLGLIIQPAYQDEFLVPIIQASTTYSVRVTLSISAPTSSGAFNVDLNSPSIGRSLGVFSVPFSQLTTGMQIVTGTLLTTTLAPVPNDLVLRLYTSNHPNGVTITVDRVEPFPTEKPNLNGQVIGSYQQNFEAFDRVTGPIDGNTTNQQPINAGFVLFDTFYMVKTKTILGINSVAGQEPAQWGPPRTVSQTCGTDSVYGVTTDDQGAEWAIIAGQKGAYLFTGGEPIPITEEIASLWNTINWKYGYTLQVKNDVINRRVLFFVPLKKPTPDANGNLPAWYHPDLNLTANPTTPNICLALNYKQLFTAGELGDRIEVHASSYTGKLLTIDISRKWSIWSIAAPASGFLTQADNTEPLFVGNSNATGKAYQLTEGLLDDDGLTVKQRYCTYGFISTDQEQQLQVGSVRKLFDYMRILMTGIGFLRLNLYIDNLFSEYSTTLQPDIELPLPVSGDAEIPLNETGERAFVEFVTKDVGTAFSISKINMGLRQDPWSPVRGRND